MNSPQRLLIAFLCLPLLGGCASTLTMWDAKSYTPVLDTSNPEVQLHKGDVKITEGPDMEAQADWLYSQGYLLLGYSKFTHTVVPGFANKYAEMYGEKIGAGHVMQETPKKVSSDVYAYTVTFWARGRHFPLGAYYNDVPDQTRLYYPDSLREYLHDGRPVLIEDVVVNSPAAGAGLKAKELIIGMDGKPLNGAEDLDQRLRANSGQPIKLTLWSASGMRTVALQLGQVTTAENDIPGSESLFYRNPWELSDYKDFSYISHAFEQAVKDAMANYRAQQEAQRQAAYNAWQNSRISALEKSQDSSRRGAPPTRMGIPSSNVDMKNLLTQYNSGNSLGSAYGDLMSSWYFTHKSMWVPSVVGGSEYPM
jgi:membrane-associated protease RseP (regulator of RpoE activity)